MKSFRTLCSDRIAAIDQLYASVNLDEDMPPDAEDSLRKAVSAVNEAFETDVVELTKELNGLRVGDLREQLLEWGYKVPAGMRKNKMVEAYLQFEGSR